MLCSARNSIARLARAETSSNSETRSNTMTHHTTTTFYRLIQMTTSSALICLDDIWIYLMCHRYGPQESLCTEMLNKRFLFVDCDFCQIACCLMLCSARNSIARLARAETSSNSETRSNTMTQHTTTTYYRLIQMTTSSALICLDDIWIYLMCHRYGPQESLCTEMLNKRFLFVDCDFCQIACCLMLCSARNSIARLARAETSSNSETRSNTMTQHTTTTYYRLIQMTTSSAICLDDIWIYLMCHRYGPQESLRTEMLNKRFLFVDWFLPDWCLMLCSARNSIARLARAETSSNSETRSNTMTQHTTTTYYRLIQMTK